MVEWIGKSESGAFDVIVKVVQVVLYIEKIIVIVLLPFLCPSCF